MASEVSVHPLLITIAACGGPNEFYKGRWQKSLKPQICSLFCLLSGTGILCRAHQYSRLHKMCLSGRGAKELTQDSLFSPKLYPVLAFGVGRPSRAPLVTGVRAHVGSLEVGMGEGHEPVPTSGPIVS